MGQIKHTWGSTRNVRCFQGSSVGSDSTRGLCHSFQPSFSKTPHPHTHLSIHPFIHHKNTWESTIYQQIFCQAQTNVLFWLTWFSIMAVIVTCFRASESWFIPSCKVQYPNLAHCFLFFFNDARPFHLIHGCPTHSVLLFSSNQSQGLQFSVLCAITAENSCSKVTHSLSLFPAQKT